jgi:hypothetical protein
LGYSGNLLSSDEMTILQFHIVPNAKQSKVTREHGGAIKIGLRASALEGAERFRPLGLTIAGAQRDHRLRIWCVANKPFGSGIAPRDTESFTHFVDLRCG